MVFVLYMLLYYICYVMSLLYNYYTLLYPLLWHEGILYCIIFRRSYFRLQYIVYSILYILYIVYYIILYIHYIIYYIIIYIYCITWVMPCGVAWTLLGFSPPAEPQTIDFSGNLEQRISLTGTSSERWDRWYRNGTVGRSMAGSVGPVVTWAFGTPLENHRKTIGKP